MRADVGTKPLAEWVAERWVGSCRRELFDHVIALNERHLKLLLAEYVSYHHEDRTHLGTRKGNAETQNLLRNPRSCAFL
jgi:hypothetical protein